MLALGGPTGVVGAPTPAWASEAAPLAAPLTLPQAEDFTEGLRVEASTTYTVDLTTSVVHVESVATLTNQIPDRVMSTYVEEFYFDAYSAPILVGATNVGARLDGGGGLGVSVEPGDGEFMSVAVIALSPSLSSGSTRTIHLTYDLPTQPPRSGALAQVNQAFATFPMFSAADPGLGTITVVLPGHLEVEVVGSEMESSAVDGTVVYTAAGIADPAIWFATILARDDEALVERIVFFGDNGIRIQGWPGDSEWLDFTSDLAERGLPAMESAIGRRWNATERLDIVETSAPYVYGYAGWYEHSRSLIEVGDALDAQVTLHEMAHVWFNEEIFLGRWVNEAMADEFAALAMADLGLERPLPKEVAPDVPGALPLNDWSTPDLDAPESREQETYGYNTSWWVAHRLVEEIGVDGVSEVVQAAADRQTPYPAETSDAPLPRTADWRTLLDLLEGVGGSTESEQIFRDLVVSDADLALLDERAAAREEYEGLLVDGEGWAPPAALRNAMADWVFDDATALVPEVTALLERRDAVADDLKMIDEEVPIALQEEFEASDDLDELDGVMDDVDEAADALVGAVTDTEQANPLARVGLLFGGVEDDLDTARAALADGAYSRAEQVAEDADDDVAAATATGALRLATLAVALLLIGVGVRQVLRRRRTPPGADADAQPHLTTTSATPPPPPPPPSPPA